jgi:outer membrane protein assembly factor BamB
MAKTEKIRVHLVLPGQKADEQDEEGTEPVGVCADCGGELVIEEYLSLNEAVCDDCEVVGRLEIDYQKVSRPVHLKKEFKYRFHLAHERYCEHVGKLEGQEFLSTRILEDLPDHREDIQEVYELAKQAYPEADVLMNQGTPSSSHVGNDEFRAYVYDVIILVCENSSDAPIIKQRIEINEATLGGYYSPRGHGEYIISTLDSNLVAFDLDRGIESWRKNTRHDKLSKNYGFEEGIIQTPKKPQNTLFLVSREDGTTEWLNEDVTAGEDADIRVWEPAFSEKAMYAGSSEATIYRVDVETGSVEALLILDSEIREIKFDSSSLYVITANEQDLDDKSRGEALLKPRECSLHSIINGTVKWTAEFVGTGFDGKKPYVTNDTVIIRSKNELRAYDREHGNERWSLSKDDFESKLGLEQSGGSRGLIDSGRFSIIDSIGNTVYCRGPGGSLSAIDGATGKFNWINQDYWPRSGLSEYNGEIVFNHPKNEFVSCFVALDPESGSEQWQFEVPGWTPSKSLGTDLVFFTTEACIVLKH